MNAASAIRVRGAAMGAGLGLLIPGTLVIEFLASRLPWPSPGTAWNAAFALSAAACGSGIGWLAPGRRTWRRLKLFGLSLVGAWIGSMLLGLLLAQGGTLNRVGALLFGFLAFAFLFPLLLPPLSLFALAIERVTRPHPPAPPSTSLGTGSP